MPKTYNDIYIETRRRLRDEGISAFSLEARILLASAAGKTKDELMREMHLYTSEAVEEKVKTMLERRLSGEPVAYVTGDWEFYGIPISVTRDVLIPRNDSEVLAETAITALRGRKMDARVLDLCAGSGCLGCAIAKELPASRVILADKSGAALAVAKHNVMLNRLNPRVNCVELDALSAPPMMLGSFDLMVCNPPYIPSADLLTLDKSVRDFEPMEALDGGEDGLIFYREILKKWLNVVRVGGLILFEVGIDQAAEVSALMEAAGLKNIGTIRDTQEIERVVFGNV
ncbi:MAG: peptide chain release factor N(5)-glutamine methyltransferase [Oscillospiraceae bacterium]